MTARQEAEIITLLKIGKRHGKRYSFPSQSTWRALLKAYHSFEISERTLRRDLRDLEACKFLETVHRKRRVVGEGRVFTSNLYKFKKKVFIWLRSMEVLTKSLFKHFRRPNLADNQLCKKQAFTVGPAASCGIVVEKVEMVAPDEAARRIRALIDRL